MAGFKLARRNREDTRPLKSGWPDFDRLFENWLSLPFSREWGLDTPTFAAEWLPAVDIEETENEYRIHAEMPGMKKEDVKVTVVDNVLTISGEKKAEAEQKDEKRRLHRSERIFGTFQRSFTLPEPVVADKIAASFKDGVLTVVVPKSEEAKPRKIEVKVN